MHPEFTRRFVCPGLAIACALGLLLIVFGSAARAGGLYVTERATSDMGAANSGILAGSNGAGSALANPAATTLLDGHSLHLGLAPGFSITRFDQDDDPRNSGGDGGNQGGFVPLLSSSYVHKLHERVRLSFGTASISGASLDPNNDWAGREQMTEISLFTLSFLPSVGVRVTDWLSIGGGPLVTYATLDWDLRVQDPGSPGDEIDIRLEDLDDWGVAGVVAVLLEPHDDLRVGIVYQSRTDFRLSGSGETSSPLTGDITTKVDLDLPRALRADLRWQAFESVAFSFGGAWEDWSELENTDIFLGDSPSQDINLGFRDTWRLRGGIHYQLDERILLQTGVSYDSSAVRTKNRIAALPTDEQWRWGIGGTYDWSEGTRLGFAFQWTHAGNGRLRNPAVKGEYEKNDVFFFVMTMDFSRLPWDGMGTF